MAEQRAEFPLYYTQGPARATGEVSRTDRFSEMADGAAEQLNADEIAALFEGRMLKASLEVYSPLGELSFPSGSKVENRAQSLTALKVGTDRITHIDDSQSTR